MSFSVGMPPPDIPSCPPHRYGPARRTIYNALLEVKDLLRCSLHVYQGFSEAYQFALSLPQGHPGLVFIWIGQQQEMDFFSHGSLLTAHGFRCAYYQTEPLVRASNMNALAEHIGGATWLEEIWDYSHANIAMEYAHFPQKQLRLVPPGFVSDYAATGPLTRTSHPRVVFMGYKRSCGMSQANVVYEYHTYTDDEWRRFITAEPSVFLNLHGLCHENQDDAPLETFRLSSYLSLGLFVISQRSFRQDEQEYESLVTFEPNIFGVWSAATIEAYSRHAQNATMQARRMRAFRERFGPVRILQKAGLLAQTFPPAPPARPPVSPDSVRNLGADCFRPCDQKAGACRSFCGVSGACCRKGWGAALHIDACGGGTEGCEDLHCCIVSATTL